MAMEYQEQYVELLDMLLSEGDACEDRTGVGTLSVFGAAMKFHAGRNEFPLLTARKLSFKAVKTEVLWYLRGEPHLGFLHENGVHFWDPWAKKIDQVHDYWVGPVYGVQWRGWKTLSGKIDQVAEALADLKSRPDSRRIVVSAWNPAETDKMALPPCPFAFQLRSLPPLVEGGRRRLSMAVYQRSCDAFVGLPHDVAGHALLLHMFAHCAEMSPWELSFHFGDLHLYRNHVDAAAELIQRTPRDLPRLWLRDAGQKTMDDFLPDDFEVERYDPHPAMKVEVAV